MGGQQCFDDGARLLGGGFADRGQGSQVFMFNEMLSRLREAVPEMILQGRRFDFVRATGRRRPGEVMAASAPR
ncbi:hypothetical protein [Nocardia sp. NPDC051981]|uniref:hypothetical protein n=1 Tax=Nocardia sp. NPDC051981 TaxID=3155417 RepID=UPI00343E1D5D